MKKEIIFELQGLYRDNFRIAAYTFGEGEPSLCIVGAMRGNENQQLYCCSRLIERLKKLEEAGRLIPGHQVMVIPCVNPNSMNIRKRFWSIDNTDINRMFPGYDQGETTQRIAAAVFNVVKEYKYGVQFASFYMPGAFVPHVRVMKTGYENIDIAKEFGLPYVVRHTPRPFDTATLNYNWQIWETQAFSVYTTNTARIDVNSAHQAEEAVLNFMSKRGILRYHGYDGYVSQVVESKDFVNVRAEESGFFECSVQPGLHVEQGQLLARIRDPYEGVNRADLTAPVDGIVAFVGDEPTVYENTAVIKLIKDEE